MLLGDQLRPAQIIQGPLDGGAGQPQFGGDRPYPRPALALAVSVVLQVHIHRPGPMAEVGLIDFLEVSHYSCPSSVRTTTGGGGSRLVRLA